MTEFKQIIGRGTRINESFGKSYFTIMDFRNVTSLFADKDFDGDPVRVKNISGNDDLSTIEDEDESQKIVDGETGEDVKFLGITFHVFLYLFATWPFGCSLWIWIVT